MKSPRTTAPAVSLALSVALAVSLAAAQQPGAQPKPQPAAAAPATAERAPAATIDTLLAAEAYAVYGEMRGVGQYFASEEFKATLEPLRLPGAIPDDMLALLDFISSHAERLSTSRVAFAALPASEGLPAAVAAVELSSAEDARKFEPQLRAFLTKHLPAPEAEEIAGAKPAGVPGGDTPAGRRAQRRRAQVVKAKEEATPPFHLKRSGSLVVMADKQFTFRRLRLTETAPLLANEPGFAAARARLSGETVFVYVNTTRLSRSFKRQMEEMERQREMIAAMEKPDGQAGATNANVLIDPELVPADDRPLPVGTTAAAVNSNMTGPPSDAPAGNLNTNGATTEADIPLEALAKMSPEELAALGLDKEGKPRKLTPEEEEQQRVRERRQAFENQLGRLIFSGSPSDGAWPESIGVGAAMDGDSFVLRAFFVGDTSAGAVRPIPFIPVVLAGPQLQPEAAGVAPANTDIFLTASLDLPQMYDYVSSAFKLLDLADQATGEGGQQGLFESQVNAFEKANNFRIRADLISSLGNEIAVCLPGDFLGVRRGRQVRAAEPKGTDGKEPPAPAGPTGPVVLISLNDKEALQKLLPRLLEAVGLKGATEQQLIQKQGDVEYLTFAQGAVAFIDRFLVVAPDAAAMRWVVDAYNRRETLAASDEFRASSGWQPRPLLGQIYVSNALLKEAFGEVYRSAEDVQTPALRALLAQLDPNPGAVTHALTRDPDGLMHELRLPKNLLSLVSASDLVGRELAPMRAHESRAIFALMNIHSRQNQHKEDRGAYAGRAELERYDAERQKEMTDAGAEGGPGTLDFETSPFKLEGYDLKITASGDKFEATATPTVYRKTGRRSFYIDQTGQLRGADLGGKPANAQTEPVDY